MSGNKVAQAPKPAPVPWEQQPWSYQAATPYAYVDPRPSDLDEQVKRNNEHDHRAYTRVIQEGGCNAEFVPFEYASFCGKGAFGGPQMGSTGD